MSVPVDRLGRPRRYHGGRRRRHWTRERVLAKVREWHDLYGEPPRASDWDPFRMKQLADRMQEKVTEWEERIALFASSDWPSRRTIVQLFGSWNDMISEAGFQHRPPGQNTPRPSEPSPFLVPLGHAVKAVYAAEDVADDESLIEALRTLETTARTLRRQVERRTLDNSPGVS